MRKEILIAGILAAAISGCSSLVHDEPLYEFRAGDYYSASFGLKSLADQGNPEAETALGYLYQYGYVYAADERKSLALYKAAIAQGYAPAEACLGVLYVRGATVPHDYTQAMTLFQDAASKGFVRARGDISRMYGEGLGVPEDEAKAKEAAPDSIWQADHEWGEYLDTMHRSVTPNVNYVPGNESTAYTRPATIHFFVVARRAKDATIDQSSGSPALDQDLLRAVNMAVFPAPPLGLMGPGYFSISAFDSRHLSK